MTIFAQGLNLLNPELLYFLGLPFLAAVAVLLASWVAARNPGLVAWVKPMLRFTTRDAAWLAVTVVVAVAMGVGWLRDRNVITKDADRFRQQILTSSKSLYHTIRALEKEGYRWKEVGGVVELERVE